MPEVMAKVAPGATPPSTERRLAVDLEVDGGIDEHTAPLAAAAGANVFVAGSAVFGHGTALGGRRVDPARR